MSKYRVDTPICDQLDLEDFLDNLDTQGWDVVSVSYMYTSDAVTKTYATYALRDMTVRSIAWCVVSKHKKKGWWQRIWR